MPLRIIFWSVFLGLLLAIDGRAAAQTGAVGQNSTASAARPVTLQNQPAPPRYASNPQPSPLRPNQPVDPQHPTLQRRPGVAAQPPQPRAPFTLTAQQEGYLDQVLKAWERQSDRVKTFECKFTRWEYDPVFRDPGNPQHDPNKPKYVDQGKIKYAAPDKGSFEIEGARAEKWVCDGEWIHEFDHTKKQVTQHQLPPELRGKAIAEGPLPFLFGAEAAKLKQRYFLRVIQPPVGRKGEIWLEAYPKFAQDSANFSRAEVILTVRTMKLFGMDIYLPNGRNHTAYQFYDVVVNDPLRFFKGDPFRVLTPRGWRKVVKRAPVPQIGQPLGEVSGRPGAGALR